MGRMMQTPATGNTLPAPNIAQRQATQSGAIDLPAPRELRYNAEAPYSPE
jgi:hypothetical protein